jgi:hypothetical protein
MSRSPDWIAMIGRVHAGERAHNVARGLLAEAAI